MNICDPPPALRYQRKYFGITMQEGKRNSKRSETIAHCISNQRNEIEMPDWEEFPRHTHTMYECCKSSSPDEMREEQLPNSSAKQQPIHKRS